MSRRGLIFWHDAPRGSRVSIALLTAWSDP